MTDWWADGIAGGAVLISGLSARYAWSQKSIAEGAARDARRVADAEVGRDHEMYEPQQNGEFVVEGGNLFYEFRLPRRYAVLARTEAQGGVVFNDITPGQRTIDGVWRVPLDAWTGTQTAAGWQSLTVKFWPPGHQTGKPKPWICRCGRDLEPSDDAGHWQWDLGVPQSADGLLRR